MIKAVIFDADGVLLKKEQYFSQRSGIPSRKVSPFFEGVFQECLVGKADLKEELGKYIDDWGWQGTVESLLQFWFAGEKQTDAVMFDYVDSLKRKSLKVFLATNNEKYRVNYLIRELKLEKQFDKIYSSGHVGFKKPDPKFFQHILTEQKLIPEEVIFWDDDLSHVRSAKSLGIHAELFIDRMSFVKRMKKYRLDSSRET